MKRDERKFLKDPDEFVQWTNRIGDWARRHRNTLVLVAGVAGVIALAGGFWTWRSVRQTEDASEAFRVARGKFVGKQYAAAATDFDALAHDYPGTAFGRLAVLYRGYCLAATGDSAGAGAAFEDFLARFGNDPYIRQLALTNLARAQEQSGNTTGARSTATSASEIPGPYQIDALLMVARLSEAAGDVAAASDAYRKVLDANPDGDTKAFVQRRLPQAAEPSAG